MRMKYVVKNCPCLRTSIYADGKKINNECGNSTRDELCKNIDDCVMKDVIGRLLLVAENNACSRCDGCGYFEGCTDTTCGTHAALESLKFLKVEMKEK